MFSFYFTYIHTHTNTHTHTHITHSEQVYKLFSSIYGQCCMCACECVIILTEIMSVIGPWPLSFRDHSTRSMKLWISLWCRTEKNLSPPKVIPMHQLARVTDLTPTDIFLSASSQSSPYRPDSIQDSPRLTTQGGKYRLHPNVHRTPHQPHTTPPINRWK